MGNKIESNEEKHDGLDDLKKSLQTMSDDDMKDVKGGKKPSSNKWNINFTCVTPQ